MQLLYERYCDKCWATFDNMLDASGIFFEDDNEHPKYYDEPPRCESSFCRSTVGLERDPDTGMVYCAKCWEKFDRSHVGVLSDSPSDSTEEPPMCMTRHCGRVDGLEQDPDNGNLYCQSCWNEFDQKLENGFTSADAHTYLTGGSSDSDSGPDVRQWFDEEPIVASSAVFSRLHRSASKRRLARKHATAKREAEAMAKCSFKPTIPQRTARSGVRRRKGKPLHLRLYNDHTRRAKKLHRLRQEKQEEEDHRCTFTPAVPSMVGGARGRGKSSVDTRMRNDIERRQAELKEGGTKSMLKVAREMKHCTFKPTKSVASTRRKQSKKDVVNRLTRRSRQHVMEERARQKHHFEIAECTFKPNTKSHRQPMGGRLTYYRTNDNPESTSTNHKPRPDPDQLFDRLSKPVAKAKKRLPAECTFHPKISAKSALMAPIVISHYEDLNDDEAPPQPANVWDNLHQTHTKHTSMLPTGSECPFEPQLNSTSRRNAQRRQDRVNDRLYGGKKKTPARSRLRRLLGSDADTSQAPASGLRAVVMRVGSPRYTQGSHEPNKDASAVVVGDVNELLRTSAAMSVRSKKSSQTQATERLSSRRPYIAPNPPTDNEVAGITTGGSIIRGWEKRGVFGAPKAKKEW